MKKTILALALLTTSITATANDNISVTPEIAKYMPALIIASGYTCDSLTAANRKWDGDFSAWCNNWQYRYSIENVGGNFVVKVIK